MHLSSYSPVTPQFGSNRKWTKGKSGPAPQADAQSDAATQAGAANKDACSTHSQCQVAQRSTGRKIASGVGASLGIGAALAWAGGLCYGSFKSLHDIYDHPANHGDLRVDAQVAFSDLQETEPVKPGRAPVPDSLDESEAKRSARLQLHEQALNTYERQKENRYQNLLDFSFELLKENNHPDLAQAIYDTQNRLSDEDRQAMNEIMDKAYQADNWEQFDEVFNEFADRVLSKYADAEQVAAAKADFKKAADAQDMNPKLFAAMAGAWLGTYLLCQLSIVLMER